VTGSALSTTYQIAIPSGTDLKNIQVSVEAYIAVTTAGSPSSSCSVQGNVTDIHIQ